MAEALVPEGEIHGESCGRREVGSLWNGYSSALEVGNGGRVHLGLKYGLAIKSKGECVLVMFGFRRNPDVAGNGRSEGRKRVRPIAIDYRTVAGTARAGYKGDRRSKGPDSQSPGWTPTALRRHKGGET